MTRRFQRKKLRIIHAITTWGVFKPEEGGPDHIILMDARAGVGTFLN